MSESKHKKLVPFDYNSMVPPTEYLSDPKIKIEPGSSFRPKELKRFLSSPKIPATSKVNSIENLMKEHEDLYGDFGIEPYVSDAQRKEEEIARLAEPVTIPAQGYSNKKGRRLLINIIKFNNMVRDLVK